MLDIKDKSADYVAGTRDMLDEVLGQVVKLADKHRNLAAEHFRNGASITGITNEHYYWAYRDLHNHLKRQGVK